MPDPSFPAPAVAEALSSWFSHHRRELPWRENRTAYRVWLSEIMCQQTRISVVVDYYLRFLQHFPTVFDLAAAHEDEVLGLWSGLGYYSRGRNVHKAAKQVVDDYEGVFPNTSEGLRQLAGVGPYTSRAIASFAFGERCGVVDGNVHRVVSRLTDDDTPVNTPAGHDRVQAVMDALVDVAATPALVNEGVMELGALLCTPKSPSCASCPVADVCQSRAAGTQLQRPVKKPKSPRKKVHWVAVNVVRSDGNLWVEKNTDKRLFGALYGPPAVEVDGHDDEQVLLSAAQQLVHQRGLAIDVKGPPTAVRRVLTHRELLVQVFTVHADDVVTAEVGTWLDLDAEKLPVGLSTSAKAMLQTASAPSQGRLL